ncbi:uncharacterized protein (DUF885 family) [Pseudoduganella flava]|uniref:DUF885 family protein n=1 Tax=Pseudoduganella flava TaxID=871742 RepID=A0A562PIS2_9BURK|nr:DUF885 domain-containing protein [Pseudoduganella flava]QGZ41948.1 DUF885 family protein [Pseudoduganella flava]TWI44362.1 uncharacterized protein (DUF885 family) [Pseudoduganella flava]
MSRAGRIATLTALHLALFAAAGCAAAAPAWVAKSDAYTQPVLKDTGKYQPEDASSLGNEEFDTAVADFKPRDYERELADTEQRLAALRKQRAAEPDAKVRQDLDILIDSREKKIAAMKLERQYLLGYVNVGELVYGGLQALLDPRNKPERQKAALVRLKRYAGLEPGYTPLATLARARAEERLKQKGLIGPYVGEVEEALNNNATYMDGIAELLRNAKLTGWEADLDALKAQVKAYDDWTRASILPRARKEVRLPAALYANRLVNVGVDIAPEQMIERASFDFQEVRDQMQVVANAIAAQRKLPSSDYRAVIRELKKTAIPADQLLPYYRQRVKEIEGIIRKQGIVTLPDRDASIRTATNAEAARSPAPFMSPPRLIGNTGEYGEFVIPLANPNAKSKAKMDDFDFEAMAWTLTAHEARPGHELQFASMVEQGMSIARANFAFNSTNVEGWGLYSEATMLPYMPPESQLVSLQARLLRMARAMLDPMINLGRMTPEQAKAFLMKEVVLSEPFAQSEVDRYSYRAPGQATSYYYGYVKLRALKTLAEIELGDKFDLKAFNDFVIAQGILPPALLKEAVVQDFIAPRKAR